MFGILDRFEGHFAVIELYNGEILNIHISKMPQNAKEGDVLNIEENITINYDETNKRKLSIEKLSKDIWN